MNIKEAEEMLCKVQEGSKQLCDGLTQMGLTEAQIGEIAHTFQVLNFAGSVIDGNMEDAKHITQGVTYMLTDCLVLGIIMGAYAVVIPEGITKQ